MIIKKIINYKLSIVNWSKRGYSSAGRAPALQAGGQRFDPVYLHQTNSIEN